MQPPKSIEDIESVYEIGYYAFLKYGESLPLTLMAAIKSIMTNASEYKQKELLGIEAYKDYKKYSNEVEKDKFDNFYGLLDYIFPGNFNLKKEKESSLLEYLVKEDEILPEDLICARISKDYFSIKDFNEYIYQKNFENKKN